MKKLLVLVLALTLAMSSFVACGNNIDDLEYVKKNGKIIIGITEFKPMDYLDESGNWVGFDADMARLFAESLGVEAEFVIVDWDNKTFELNGKKVDCVWNGMTLCDEVLAAMDCSNAYCNNAQTVIVKNEIAGTIRSVDDVKDFTFAVEASSAGAKIAEENGYKFNAADSQASALLEVKSGKCEAAIIDSLMAAAMVGEGTSYEDLVYTINLNSEEYGVGFRKGSSLVEKLNDFFKTAYADGTMQKVAEKYGVQAALIEQK